MAITVHVAADSGAALHARPELLIEPEAAFWFLKDLFDRVADETGQRVAFADDATFRGTHLGVLDRELRERLRELGRMGEVNLQVPTTGTVVPGRPPKLVVEIETVRKDEVVVLLRQLLSVVERARAAHAAVAFVGD